MGLYPSQNIVTPEQAVARGIDSLLMQAAQANKLAYEGVRALIHKNGAKFTADQVYAAWAANTQTGLTPEQLADAAMLMKATLNLFTPGTIVDDVPEATITFPQPPLTPAAQ